MRRLEIILPYPSTPEGRKNWSKWYSLNAYWSGKHWANRKKDADFWRGFVKSEMYKQKIPKKPFEKPVKIRFWWNDGLDVDNHAAMAKMIVDALKGWVIVNDSKRYYASCEHCFHLRNYIIVEVFEYKGAGS